MYNYIIKKDPQRHGFSARPVVLECPSTLGPRTLDVCGSGYGAPGDSLQ